MAKGCAWDGYQGGRLSTLSLLVAVVASGSLAAQDVANPLLEASTVIVAADGPQSQTISVEHLVAALSRGDNAGVLELGLHWPPIPTLPTTREVLWWDAAQHLVEQAPQMVLLPLSSGHTIPLADGDSPLGEAYRYARAREEAGDEPLLVPLSVIAEAVSFAKADDPSSSAPLLGTSHHGPWRLEAWGSDLIHRRHLAGDERWLSVNLRLLGEPRWAAAEGLRANVVWERSLSDGGQSRPLTTSTPEPGTAPRHPSAASSRAGAHSSKRQQHDSDTASTLTINGIERSDHHLQLAGQLFVEELREHQLEQAWAVDVWHQLDLQMTTEGSLWMAILNDATRRSDLAAELDLPASQLRSPGLILVHVSADSDAPPPFWPEVEPLERDWAAAQQRMRSVRNGIPYRSNGTHARWLPLHHGHLQRAGLEGALLRLTWNEVINQVAIPIALTVEIPWDED